VLEQGQNVVSQSRWVSVASRGSDKIERLRRQRKESEEGQTDIGSRVFVSQGLRCSDVEASKTMRISPDVEDGRPKCKIQWHRTKAEDARGGGRE
jgi:hypothetical protein